VVTAENRVILTTKIYRENPRYERFQLWLKLSELFQVDRCLVIPREGGDKIGHSDGVVRFLNEDMVVVNDYSRVDPAYGKRLRGVLAKEGLRIEKLPHFREDWVEDGIPSAVGNYVNFLRIGNLIVVPAYGTRQDDRACRILERLCPRAAVVPLLCKDLARAGGVLNCVVYTVDSRGRR
jgi:agmatine/peptidylarginine deiminase